MYWRKTMLKDMDPSWIKGNAKEYSIKYYDGSSRKIFVTELETLVGDGELIVSRTDPKGIITHVNASFLHLSGYSREELIGAPHYILRHPDMPAVAFKGLWDDLFAGKRWNGYVKNLRKDGGFYWVYATAIPNVRNGTVVGFTSVRRKPSRKKVNEAIALYKTLL